MAQVKEQIKTPEKELNEMEVSNLPDTESKQLYLVHRNKHRGAAKMRRQRNMDQMKEQGHQNSRKRAK